MSLECITQLKTCEKNSSIIKLNDGTKMLKQ